MKVEKTFLSDDEVQLNIEVEPERLEGSLDEAYKKLVRRVRIPGFRPGKAPRVMVERMFGRAALIEEALNDLVPQVFDEAIQQAQIEPYEPGTIEEISPPADNEPVRIRARVLLKPAVDLQDYRSLHVEAQPVEVTDETVSDFVDELRHRRGTLLPTEEAGPTSVVEVTGQEGPKDGPMETFERVHLHLDQAFPDIREALLGAKIGEEREIRFSADEGERIGRMKIEAVHDVDLPEADDEFAKSFGYENVEDMREKLANLLRQDLEASAEAARRQKILQAISESSEVRIPRVLVDRQVQRLMTERKLEGEPSAELVSEAEERVKTQLVAQALIEKENITVLPGELAAASNELARRLKIKKLGDAEVQHLYGSILEEKLQRFLGTLSKEEQVPDAEDTVGITEAE